MASREPGTLIVGAGQASVSLAAALRDAGHDGPVTIVGEERLPPYERPPLSKGYLAGHRDEASLVIRSREWLAERGVALLTDERVTALDRDEMGGVATTASGQRLDFARLVLATGAAARTLPVPGADLEDVLAIRTLVDADRLAAALRADGPLVVIGGGFLGLEVAAVAREIGREVTVVEVTDRLLARAVSPALSDFFRAAHERRGVRVLLGASVVRILGVDGHVAGVELQGGDVLRASTVVVSIGSAPRVELAAHLGLALDGGVVVDEFALGSDRVTVAVGDCACVPQFFGRGLPGLVRPESVQHATDHGRSAAATLLGQPTAYRAVPWFWSDQGDLRLQIVGLVAGADHTVVRGDPGTEAFSLLHYRDGLLVAAECVGSAADHLVVKRGLEKGLTIEPGAAADTGVPLKRLLSPPAQGSADR
ncbi:MAG TPA: FAD-dependent oxidoreductase [Intrasporangium sp.]|uniref:NAD(P)/FAD-dependent oxidoreductase n=1 Tax=Intrasporangium sp. TaxID=1925024 RepID=UPI002D766253|nr:FAD-dependent oxidoreductase [Intrasporangium sp.]HET7399252.1 FAD-dependent oxidoreductase [Intrasporangium sp.]